MDWLGKEKGFPGMEIVRTKENILLPYGRVLTKELANNEHVLSAA